MSGRALTTSLLYIRVYDTSEIHLSITYGGQYALASVESCAASKETDCQHGETEAEQTVSYQINSIVRCGIVHEEI